MSMVLNRRQILQLAGAVSVSAPMIAPAQGAASARIFVGYAPGGTVDVLARLLAPAMAPPGSTMIVENKPGASGQIAAVALSRSAPDGAHLLLTPVTNLTLTPQLYRKPLFDLKDFTPIGPLCQHPFALAVPGNSPIKSVGEFIAWGRAQQKGVSFASPGAGTSTHLLGMVLSKEIGVQMTHVGYRGALPGLQDLMAGQIESTFNAQPSMVELHRTGKIRILAHTGSRRLARLQEVPTFTELKIPGLEYEEVYGVFAPPNTPGGVVARLEENLQQAVSSPALADAWRKLEMEPRKESAAAFRRFYDADYTRWTAIAKDSGVTLDS